MRSKDIFLKSEGDSWFTRNQENLGEEKLDFGTKFIIQKLKPFKSEIQNVLEIGCSNGTKLESISLELECNGYGIDPSKNAIDQGNSRLLASRRRVELIQGTADELNFENHKFDVVFFGFCLYLIDRELIRRVIFEANRVLRSGGFLVITDFDPMRPLKVPYHHKSGLFSYKENYAKWFLDSNQYYLVAKESYSHQIDFFTMEDYERVSTQILYKELVIPN